MPKIHGKDGIPEAKTLVLLDSVTHNKGCQNDGSDQEGNHPVHITHFIPLSTLWIRVKSLPIRYEGVVFQILSF